MTWQVANEELLLYRVPIFEPFVDSGTSKATFGVHDDVVPCDADLAQFAADVQSLLGTSLDTEASDMVGLGFCQEKEWCFAEYKRVMNTEEERDSEVDAEKVELDDVAFECNLDNCSPWVCSKDDIVTKYEEQKQTDKVLLRLDYDRVMADWADQRCPWRTGHRPTNLILSEYMGVSGSMVDEEREARVCRYRVKTRSRLFSKKIRYQVRKFNAENRPRINVKRPASD